MRSKTRGMRWVRYVILAVTFWRTSTGWSQTRTRYHAFTERFRDPPHAAKPVMASYIGGPGDEYLIGAAVLPDGRVVLGGHALGPELSLGDATIRVVGRDTVSAPRPEIPRDRQGQPHWVSWTSQQGAGFWLILSSDLRRIERAARLPWNAGVLTDVTVDEEGRIYVTGRVGPQFDAVGSSKRLDIPSFQDPAESFVAKLTRDGTAFEWCVRIADAPDSTAALRLVSDDRLAWVGSNAVHLDRQGRLLNSCVIGYPPNWARGVRPSDFLWAVGGDRNTRTGYEPWRQPTLRVHRPDGTLLFRAFEWDGRVVGMNLSRLVSDSSIRVITFDHQGRLVAAGWSDGGNTVLATVPLDLTRSAASAIEELTGQKTGLPFSLWGAGVSSFAHLIRLDPENAMPSAYSPFAAFLADRDRPNGAQLSMLESAPDGSLLMSGGTAWGLIQTSAHVINRLSPEAGDYMGGPFIAVLTPDWTSLRYCSAVPGAGRVELHRNGRIRGSNFRASARLIQNRQRAVFVSGATWNDKFTPLNAMQSGFGGGTLDGWFAVLEMDALPSAPPRPPTFATAGGRAPGVGKGEPGLAGRFVIRRGMRNEDCLIILRDSKGEQWPTFYRGHPDGDGEVRLPDRGRFTLVGPADGVQLKGGLFMSRRVGGREGTEEIPEIRLDISVVDPSRVRVKISYNGRELEKEGPWIARPSRPTGQGVNLRGHVTATRYELGLAPPTSPRARDEIHIEWWTPARP